MASREASVAGNVTREEFAVLEREVEGEKLVTRHILEQTRRNGDDLAAIKTRLDRVETRLDRVERKIETLDAKVDGVSGKVELVSGKVDGLAKGLPGIVADTMRDVLRERDRG